MVQAVVLAVGNTTATSSAITVTTTPVTVYVYSSSPIPKTAQLNVSLTGPGSTVVPIGTLTAQNPAMTLTSPGSYAVTRNVSQLDGASVGVATET